MDYDLGDDAGRPAKPLAGVDSQPHSGRLPGRLHRRTRTIWPPPRRSASCWLPRACWRWPGRKSMAAAVVRSGSRRVLREEMWAQHEPRGPQYMGINWVGPALMRYGTDRAEGQAPVGHRVRGSDLVPRAFPNPKPEPTSRRCAPAPCRTVTGWRITGQKVWTSYALMASWCVLAACTDPDAPKPKRLTPVSDPDGPRRVSPSGRSGRCWDRITSTRCSWTTCRRSPATCSARSGDGWRVMREALAFERVGIARYARCESLLAPDAHRTRRRLGPAARIASRPVGAGTRRLAGGQAAGLSGRVAAGRSRGGCGGQRRPHRHHHLRSAGRRAAVRRAGPDPRWTAAAPRALHGAIEDHWRYAQAATVASGTIEVQRMLVARDVLGEHR